MQLTIKGTNIEIVEQERFLGVIFDNKLSWSQHVNQLSAKISRYSGILYKLKGIDPHSVLKLLYNSFIQSHLNYCSTVWGLGSKNSLNKLFVSQKKAIRAIGNTYNNYFFDADTQETPCHTKIIFTQNEFLTVHNIVTKNTLVYMHKAYLNCLPNRILQLFSAATANRPRREAVFFDTPFSRLASSDKIIRFKGPKLYNSAVNYVNKHILLNCKYPNFQHRYVFGFLKIIQKYLTEEQKRRRRLDKS